MRSGVSNPLHLPYVPYYGLVGACTCNKFISSSTRGGMEGVEGEWMTSALGWVYVVLLYWAYVIQNP
eukprot:scaffold6277_cov23-Tisochrysis_lutea.AAC.1